MSIFVVLIIAHQNTNCNIIAIIFYCFLSSLISSALEYIIILRGLTMLNQKKFVVTPKTESSVTVTVRIEKESHDRLEELVLKSGRSRNELINKAIKFALDNLEFDDGKEE